MKSDINSLTKFLNIHFVLDVCTLLFDMPFVLVFQCITYVMATDQYVSHMQLTKVILMFPSAWLNFSQLSSWI
jgi:hypothetical protein